MSTANGRLVRLNGTEMFVQVEGTGPAVVLVHGFSLDHRMWRPQVEALRRDYTVIAYDVRGFGRSAPPAGPYSQSADYLAVLRHCGIERAHLVGLSMGGRIALRCAQTDPQAVRSLTLLDAAADGMTRSAAWQERWQAITTEARSGAIDAARRIWLAHPLFAPARAVPGVAALMETMVGDYDGWHWTHPDPAETPAPPALEQPALIRVPTLVVRGDLELPDFIEVADRLARGIPGARHLVIRGAGHMVSLEAPDAVNAALRGFFEDIDGARGAPAV